LNGLDEKAAVLQRTAAPTTSSSGETLACFLANQDDYAQNREVQFTAWFCSADSPF
jgi:hypothetical protein